MKTLLLCAATEFEIMPLARSLGVLPGDTSMPIPGRNDLEVQALVTGPGMVQSCFELAQTIYQSRPTVLLHIGVAGGRRGRFEPGDVVQVISDFFADAGAETSDGQLLDMFDMGLWNRNEAPFSHGVLENPLRWNDPEIPEAAGATVNRIPGTKENQLKLALQKDYDVESMEGAAIFYTARRMGIPFYCLRGISNPIEPRNRANWILEEAISRVSNAAERLIMNWRLP